MPLSCLACIKLKWQGPATQAAHVCVLTVGERTVGLAAAARRAAARWMRSARARQASKMPCMQVGEVAGASDLLSLCALTVGERMVGLAAAAWRAAAS